MSQMRKCCNCGPGAPSKTDERWLCEQCATIYAFNEHGGMFRQPRPGPAAAAVESPREEKVAGLSDKERRALSMFHAAAFANGGDKSLTDLEFFVRDVVQHFEESEASGRHTRDREYAISMLKKGLEVHAAQRSASPRVSQEELEQFQKLRWTTHICGACSLRFSECRLCGGNKLTVARGEAEQCGGHQPKPCGADCAFVSAAMQPSAAQGAVSSLLTLADHACIEAVLVDWLRSEDHGNCGNGEIPYRRPQVEAALASLRGARDEPPNPEMWAKHLAEENTAAHQALDRLGAPKTLERACLSGRSGGDAEPWLREVRASPRSHWRF